MTNPSATAYPKKRDGKRWSTKQPLVGTCRNGHPWATSVYVKKNGDIFCSVCCYNRRAERRRMALKFPERVQPAEVRLLDRIDMTPGQGPNGDCWTYSWAKDKSGYGQIGRFGKTISTHRLAYEITYGPIPAGLDVCHKCDFPPCCRPDHLFAGTVSDNMRDMIQKGRGPNMKVVALTRRNPVGERNGMAKLKWEWVRAIRKERTETGLSYEKLAEKFNTSSGNISNIINNKAWKERS